MLVEGSKGNILRTLRISPEHSCLTCDNGFATVKFLDDVVCYQGVCQDYPNQGEIAKLLYFESNKGKKEDITSLDEYVSRWVSSIREIHTDQATL